MATGAAFAGRSKCEPELDVVWSVSLLVVRIFGSERSCMCVLHVDTLAAEQQVDNNATQWCTSAVAPHEIVVLSRK